MKTNIAHCFWKWVAFFLLLYISGGAGLAFSTITYNLCSFCSVLFIAFVCSIFSQLLCSFFFSFSSHQCIDIELLLVLFAFACCLHKVKLSPAFIFSCIFYSVIWWASYSYCYLPLILHKNSFLIYFAMYWKNENLAFLEFRFH